MTFGKMAKTGRNEPCPCGSGKKYKQCCLAKDEAAARAAQPATPAAPPARRPSLASYFQDSENAVELTKASNGVVELIRGGVGGGENPRIDGDVTRLRQQKRFSREPPSDGLERPEAWGLCPQTPGILEAQ